MTDIREVLRRLRLGEPGRCIARELGFSRNTVAQYRRRPAARSLLEGDLADAARLAELLQPAPAWRAAHLGRDVIALMAFLSFFR